ncbi:putative sugar nucleotidyl transferase, partial [Acinetobacter baumannii]
MTLQPNEALIDQSGFVAGALEFFPSSFTRAEILSYFRNVSKIERVRRLQQTWELFQWNDEMIREDFKLVTKGKSSQSLSPTNFIHQQANIFI